MMCGRFAVRSARGVVGMSAVLAALFLGVAYVSQYGFGLFPCELCLLQRKPYMAIVALGVVSVFVKQRALGWWLAVACIALFLADSGIAAYHAGVELHWFPGPSACTASTAPQTLEEMRKSLMEAELVSCDQPMVHVLGLSMAGWNAVAALGAALLGIFTLRGVGKKA